MDQTKKEPHTVRQSDSEAHIRQVYNEHASFFSRGQSRTRSTRFQGVRSRQIMISGAQMFLKQTATRVCVRLYRAFVVAPEIDAHGLDAERVGLATQQEKAQNKVIATAHFHASRDDFARRLKLSSKEGRDLEVTRDRDTKGTDYRSGVSRVGKRRDMTVHVKGFVGSGGQIVRRLGTESSSRYVVGIAVSTERENLPKSDTTTWRQGKVFAEPPGESLQLVFQQSWHDAQTNHLKEGFESMNDR